MENPGKFLVYAVASYLSLLAFIHTCLWLTVYPHTLTTLNALQLLTWAAGGLQKAKLLSAIEYFSVCALTPLFAVGLYHLYYRPTRFFCALAFKHLLALGLVAVALFSASQWVSAKDYLPLLLTVLNSAFCLLLLALPFQKNRMLAP